MASHFKLYPASEETVIPWNARYSFPSQSNKAVKTTPRIPPKNGSIFLPGQILRIEFPAQGYVNPTNTTLEFDVVLYGNVPSATYTVLKEGVRFQNNIQSIFNRARLLYGATPLEDIIDYNIWVRCLTEWTSGGQDGRSIKAIADGVGGTQTGYTNNGSSGTIGFVNTRQYCVQGINIFPNNNTETPFSQGDNLGIVPNKYLPPGAPQPSANQNYCTQRYQISFSFGTFIQDKLIFTKWMASQLAIELTLEQPGFCIYQPFTAVASVGGSITSGPTYAVTNVNLIPEILEFDSSYDEMFLKGIQSGGVPLKFSSIHTFIFTTAGAANCSLLIQERSRSVKSLFTVQMEGQGDQTLDSHATYYDSNIDSNPSSLFYYNYRIGGRYFPAAPVQGSFALGTPISNGGCECLIELKKALNVMCDDRAPTSIDPLRWGYKFVQAYKSQDYSWGFKGFDANAQMQRQQIENPLNSFCGNLGSQCFVMAIDLETSNGIEISGLNAEEQSDIAFNAQWALPQQQGNIFRVFTYYDALLILRENNTVELIQ